MKRRFWSLLFMLLLAGCAPISIFPEDPTATATPTPAPAKTGMPSTSTPSASAVDEGNGVIAFYNNQFMGGIYLINADGSGDPVLLSAHPTNDSKPTWSPDGSQIAFESLRDDPVDRIYMDIYIMNADGGHMKRLTQTNGWFTEPDWSPDGRSLVIAGYGKETAFMDLYLLDPKTGTLTLLTNTPASERNPSWSPDGSKIVFASDMDGKWDIQTFDIETGETAQLTLGAGDNVKPDWSPDGEKILFVSTRNGDAEVFIMDVDGSNQRRLTTSPGVDTDPEWSPDGKSFVYNHGDNKFSELYIMKMDGSDPVLLYGKDGTYSGLPAWSSKAKISDAPAFGPPICMRDTNADTKPDDFTSTFTATDGFPYVLFPYRNMTTEMISSIYWDFEHGDLDYMNMVLKWKYGKTGWFWAANAKDLSGVEAQELKIQLSLNGEIVQEVDCPVVLSEAQSNMSSTPSAVVTRTPTLTPTPRPTPTPIIYLPEGFHDGSRGSVDSISCTAFGWAVDPDDRKRDLQVQVLSDGVPVATSTANLVRPDVSACTGGICGFNVHLWGLISAGEQHQIAVQAYDEETDTWVNLSSTTKLLTCWGYPEGSHDGNSGQVDQAGCVASGWAVDPDDRYADVTVRVLSDGNEVMQALANRYRSDLNKPNGCTSGSCGFLINLWNLISHNDPHKIRVQALDVQTDTWRDLPGTSKMLTCGN